MANEEHSGTRSTNQRGLPRIETLYLTILLVYCRTYILWIVPRIMVVDDLFTIDEDDVLSRVSRREVPVEETGGGGRRNT